ADTFVDFDHGLNSAVARLRETLNDSAEQPRYVETIPKRGYRFIAEIADAVTSGEIPASAPETTEGKTPRPEGALRWIAGTIALVLVVVGGVEILRRPRGKAEAPLEIIPMAVLPGYEVEPAFSPDGNQVAFREINGHRNSGIFTAMVGGESSLRLTKDPSD